MTDSARCPCGATFTPDRSIPPRESLDGQPCPRLCDDCEERRALALYRSVRDRVAAMDEDGERWLEARKAEEGTMRLWYLSFADDDFLGCAFVEAEDFLGAVVRVHALGISPGGEILGAEVAAADRVAVAMRDRLLTRDELTAIFGPVVRWTEEA